MATDIIKVQTNDGHIVDVEVEIAKHWGMIKNQIDTMGGVESVAQPVPLTEVSSDMLNKIIAWTTQHRADPKLLEPFDREKARNLDISDWDKTFFNNDQKIILGVMLAAHFLDLQLLVEMTCQIVAGMIRGKTPQQVRETFDVPNDIPPLPPLPDLQPIQPIQPIQEIQPIRPLQEPQAEATGISATDS